MISSVYMLLNNPAVAVSITSPGTSRTVDWEDRLGL